MILNKLSLNPAYKKRAEEQRHLATVQSPWAVVSPTSPFRTITLNNSLVTVGMDTPYGTSRQLPIPRNQSLHTNSSMNSSGSWFA